MRTINKEKLLEILLSFRNDWNKFSRDIFNVKLDPAQQEILHSVQVNRRTSVRSGNARGKDYVAAVSSLCFLYLNVPSKVVNTAPTDRQVRKIMMAEIAKIHKNARIPLGGEVLMNQIKFSHPDRCLLAFKTMDYCDEAWTGFHSPHLLVVVTEASGIEQRTFDNIESILTGDSKLLIVFNPYHTTGEAYNSSKSSQYHQFKLSCLDAPNVTAKQTVIPGQVDYPWVIEKIQKWCVPIDPPENIRSDDAKKQSGMPHTANHDFEFEGQWYRPNDLFRIKVMGEFPEKSHDQLIPLSWVEAAIERWKERASEDIIGDLKLGVDVAGMGSDFTVFVHRYDNYVAKIENHQGIDNMAVAGMIHNILSAHEKSAALIDTIGEGAGVCSRLTEQKLNAISAKFSESAKLKSGKELTDLTNERKFVNMRAYCWWAIRDALDPQLGANLALPPNDELIQDLTEPRWNWTSDGRIMLEEKSEIKKRLRRSPDFGDALALTYYPAPKRFTYNAKEMFKVIYHPNTDPPWLQHLNWYVQRLNDEFEWNMENWKLQQRGIIRGCSTIRRRR